MKTRWHGIVSILLFSLAILVGVHSIAIHHFHFALVYGVILLFGFPVIVFSYCCKCKGRHECAHWLPGMLTRYLPARSGKKYLLVDYVGVIIPLILMIVFPQPWLFMEKTELALFWFLLLLACSEIKFFICRNCPNQMCPSCSICDS